MRRHPSLRDAIEVLTLAAALAVPAAAWADPVLGFREDWMGTSTTSWGGGGASGVVFDNPGTGGADGDGFLRVRLDNPGQFGARSLGTEYGGDWIAAGVQVVRFSLHDLGTPDGHEIHFCIGNSSNFWQYDTPFRPSNQWVAFNVDLTSAAGFTRIIGSGTFEDALRHVDRVLIRHDVAPFVQLPENATGDLGIDRLVLLNPTTRARPGSWGTIKSLYR